MIICTMRSKMMDHYGTFTIDLTEILRKRNLAEGFESLSGYLVWTYGADDYLMLIDTKNDLYNGRTEWDEDGKYINLKKNSGRCLLCGDKHGDGL